jgi:hypothetical protein
MADEWWSEEFQTLHRNCWATSAHQRECLSRPWLVSLAHVSNYARRLINKSIGSGNHKFIGNRMNGKQTRNFSSKRRGQLMSSAQLKIMFSAKKLSSSRYATSTRERKRWKRATFAYGFESLARDSRDRLIGHDCVIKSRKVISCAWWIWITKILN